MRAKNPEFTDSGEADFREGFSTQLDWWRCDPTHPVGIAVAEPTRFGRAGRSLTREMYFRGTNPTTLRLLRRSGVSFSRAQMARLKAPIVSQTPCGAFLPLFPRYEEPLADVIELCGDGGLPPKLTPSPGARRPAFGIPASARSSISAIRRSRQQFLGREGAASTEAAQKGESGGSGRQEKSAQKFPAGECLSPGAVEAIATGVGAR
jgi:hypothetical protein